MADQAYWRGLEIREEMLGSGHGGAKVEHAAEFAREPRHAATALDGPGVA